MDAGSTKVEISIDFHRGGCTVEDNGSGISSMEFREDGGLGKIYHTSKWNADEMHGTTGTFLHSLAALSLLSIRSTTADGKESASLTIHQGKAIARQLPKPRRTNQSAPDAVGTQVTVRDLFGNMPVRVKQRVLSRDGKNVDEHAWQQLKHGIVALLLAWPKPCAVRLRDTDHSNRIGQLAGFHSAVNPALTEKSLKQLDGQTSTFDLRDQLPILSQAGLATIDSRANFIPISAAAINVSVKGLICLDPAPSKQAQFISIGIHPCSASAGHSDMYAAVNKIFSQSNFGCVDNCSDIDEAEKDRRKRDRRYKNDGYTRKQLRRRKGVDRWPMYVLQVNFRDQRDGVDVGQLSDASLKNVVDVLEATVTQWLAAHHFRPRKRRKRRNEDQETPAVATSSSRPTTVDPGDKLAHGPWSVTTPPVKRAATIESSTTSKRLKLLDRSGGLRRISVDQSSAMRSPAEYFNGWSRIKSGRSRFYDELWQSSKPATAPAGQIGTAACTAQKPHNLAFHFPSLEPGELSSAKCNAKGAAELSQPIGTRLRSATGSEVDLLGSSDEFGVVHEEDMLAAAEVAEEAKATLENHDPDVEIDPRESGDEHSDASDSFVDWIDPTTKQVFPVNTRTGVVLPLEAKIASNMSIKRTKFPTTPTRNTAAINTNATSVDKPLVLARRPISESGGRENKWLPGFLSEWKNPVFIRQDEEQIPVASFNGPGWNAVEASNKRCTHNIRTKVFAQAGTVGTSKLSKSALKHAKVIRQVDAKFILCMTRPILNGGRGETIILIDQHAASERVILEGLLNELCMEVDLSASETPRSLSTRVTSSIRTTVLERPHRFQISEVEHGLFHNHADHFATWGVLYELLEKNAAVTASQVRPAKQEYVITVTALPPAIAERCTLVPRLLVELLRSQLWSLADSNSGPRSNTHLHLESENRPLFEDEDEDHQWLKKIGSCPKGILDMLNSRACRSAVMFNDNLSMGQCEELLADLSSCAFPFMCAHGRVSMVPLVELGQDQAEVGGMGLFGTAEDNVESFTGAFQRWHGVVEASSNESNLT